MDISTKLFRKARLNNMFDLENKSFEEIEDYILHLENRIEELENQLKIKDEVIENLRNRR